MTYYQPCFNCAADRSTCERLTKLRNAIKGTGITSVKFTCPERRGKFRVGQRVEFDWRHYENIGEWHHDVAYLVFNGTVMAEKRNRRRFVIRIDQEGEIYDMKPSEVFNNPEFVSVRPDDMRALDEPDRILCPNCAAYSDTADTTRLCWMSEGVVGTPPRGCMKGRAG